MTSPPETDDLDEHDYYRIGKYVAENIMSFNTQHDTASYYDHLGNSAKQYMGSTVFLSVTTNNSELALLLGKQLKRRYHGRR